MSLKEDFKKMPTAGKVALVGGGGIALFFLGKAALGYMSGSSSTTAASTVSQPTATTGDTGATTADSATSPDYTSALNSLAQGQTQLAQTMATDQQQLAANQSTLAQLIAQSQQQTEQQVSQQLTQNSQTTTSAITSLIGKMAVGGTSATPSYASVAPFATTTVSTIPSYGSAGGGSSNRSTYTVETPSGTTVTASGSDGYNTAVNEAGGQNINHQFVAGSYTNSGQFVAKTQAGADVYNNYEASKGSSARATVG